jgi:hypothetical protein
MRAILAIIVLAVILSFLGWVTFSSDPGRSSVNVETEKIERDVRDLSESARQAGNELRRNVAEERSDADP